MEICRKKFREAQITNSEKVYSTKEDQIFLVIEYQKIYVNLRDL